MQISPLNGTLKLQCEITFASEDDDGAEQFVEGLCLSGNALRDARDIERHASAELTCDSFIYTRFTATLSTNQIMAVPNATSTPDAFARARRCRPDVQSVQDFGEKIAYCLDPEYNPLVCPA